MRRFGFFIVLLVFAIFFSSSIQAEVVVVKGDPAITQRAVDCHIKLMEFVLNTRLTVGQKNSFFRSIKSECVSMSKEERESFLQACELVDSMAAMDDRQREVVKRVLEQDFQESALSLPHDPAAQLYLKLYKEAGRMLFEFEIEKGQEKEGLTSQSFEAIVEYLGFVASPEDPIKMTIRQRVNTQEMIEKIFKQLSEDERQTLDEFQNTWFMLRAGWKVASRKSRETFKTYFEKCHLNIAAGVTPESFRKAISADLFGNLLDLAAKNGFDPTEWTPEQSIRVW